ncbi:MAG: hypothetical protein MUF54_13945 [Polyangiaceae bacterium]|nr:hypothetical protein [Polyangiaceae bacterium]
MSTTSTLKSLEPLPIAVCGPVRGSTTAFPAQQEGETMALVHIEERFTRVVRDALSM